MRVILKSLVLVLLLLGLAACGGGSSNVSGNPNSSGSPNSNNNNAVTYTFVTPTLGGQVTYKNTLIDNLNNTLNRTFIRKITAVNGDGSFSYSNYDPSYNSYTTGVVNHTLYPEAINANSVGQTINVTYTPYNGSLTTVTYTPHSGGVPSPLTLGQSWTYSFTQAYSNSSTIINYSESGSFIGTESITVPAGTFTAYKFQRVATYLRPDGVAVTETVTTWKNTSGTFSPFLKSVATYGFSGAAPPQGSTVSDTNELMSAI